MVPASVDLSTRLAARLRDLAWRNESRRMLVLSISVGATCGLAAALLISLLELCTHLFFESASQGLERWWVIAVPAVGGLLVGPLVTRFAPETRGHGVPEVMLAVAKNRGEIRGRVAVVKTLASALTIGSGGSAGREGPIVQIGAAVGSKVGRFFREPDDIVRMLVACGSAGGIAASFNAPIAGVIFALEVILRDFRARAFAMVVSASVAASVLSRSLLGVGSFFVAPAYELKSASEMVVYLLLGVSAALVARLFIWVLYAVEDTFDAITLPQWVKPAIGGLMVGVLGFFLPQVFGTGHAAIEGALSGHLALTLLVPLVFAKMVATALTLGSGGSGGVFAPALFVGAMLGGAFGVAAGQLFPTVAGPSGAYALVGMGAVFAGTSFAPITAILIIFEMTHDYALILPLMAACVTSVLVSQAIAPDSIYTTKLRRRGIDLDRAEPADELSGLCTREVMTANVETVPMSMPIAALIERAAQSVHSGFPVVDEQQRLVGFVAFAELRSAIAHPEAPNVMIAADLMQTSPPAVRPTDVLADVAATMRAHRVDRLPVVDAEQRVVGIVTDHDLVHALTEHWVATVRGAPRSQVLPK